MDLDRVDGSGRVALASDDAVDDGQVRLEQVQKVGEFLVDLVGVVPLPQEVGDGAHRVLEAEGDAGVEVRLHLRDGDVEGLSLDDAVEDLRQVDLVHDLCFRQIVVDDRLLFEGDETGAAIFRDAVVTGSLEGDRGRIGFAGGLDDGDVIGVFLQPGDDGVEDTGVRVFRIALLVETDIVVDEDEVRLDEDRTVVRELFGEMGLRVEVVEGCINGVVDRFDVLPVEVLLRAVGLRQRREVVHVVDLLRCVLDDDEALRLGSRCRGRFLLRFLSE